MPLEQAAETNAQLCRVAAALQAIKPERAEALVLRLFAGLNAAEVGRLMGKSEASAKMLALRGLRDVRERFSLEIEVNDGSK
jgi:DNA-directed RNA polymerase specialized sigma24 family protein